MNFWIKPDDGQPVSSQMLLGVEPDDAYNFYIYLRDTGAIYAYYSPHAEETLVATSEDILVDGAHTSFTMITITVYTVDDSTTLRVYLNGNMSISTTEATTSTNWDDNNLYLGCVNAGGTAQQFFSGSLDNVEIINRAMSGEEVYLKHRNTEGRIKQKSRWLIK